MKDPQQEEEDWKNLEQDTLRKCELEEEKAERGRDYELTTLRSFFAQADIHGPDLGDF